MSHAAETLDSLGALHVPDALDGPALERVRALFGSDKRAGQRLGAPELVGIRDLLRERGAIGRIASSFLGRGARPVRALLLDKSLTTNWRLGWHQDRVIAVRERVEVEGFGPWSLKGGQVHVQPPATLLGRMITLRVHVDTVDEDNAPLQIVPGSHLHGRLIEADVEKMSSGADTLSCLASPGDIWIYRTLILHASSEQKKPGRRRVLQLDYSADALPGGLRWQDLLSAC